MSKLSLGSLLLKGAGSLISGFLSNMTDTSSSSHIASQMVRSPRIRESQNASVDLPSIKAANDNIKRVSSPSVLTISNQLNSILQVANKIGLSVKRQQDQLIAQNTQKRHAEKERIMEDASREVLNDGGLNLDPLNSSFLDLSNKIKELVHSIGSDGSSSIGGSAMGMWARIKNLFGFGKSKGTRLRKGVSAVEAANGTRYRDAKTGRFIREADAVEKAGLLGRTGNFLKSTLSKIPGASRIAGIFGKGASKAAAAGGKVMAADVVKKLAIPIVSRAVGKTVLKSIPILGAIAGVGMAARRLVDGDIVGAGLDAASGLAGPLTAIPALIASVARDIYKDAYGIQPESDPNAAVRMKSIAQGVKSAVEEIIKPLIVPNSKPTTTFDMMPDGKTVKITHTGPKPEDNDVQFRPIKPRAPDSRPKPKPTPKTPPTSPKPQTKSTSVSRGKNLTSVAAAPIHAPNTKGATISNMSIHNEALTMPSNDNQATSMNPIMKARFPTTKAGYKGIGDVPDPTYYGSTSIVKQLYFDSSTVWA